MPRLPKSRRSEEISRGSIAKPSNKISDKELIAFLRTKFFGPLKRHLKDYLPYLRLAHNRFAQPGRRIPIPGRPLWSEFCSKELGVHVRTVQLWLAGDKPATKKIRNKYDAVDIAHLEKVAYAAQQLAEDNPDNAEYDPIRKAIREKPDAEITVSGITGNAVDGKHYLLTPEYLKAKIKAEFGPQIFDPCPFPRPAGFNGLEVPWGRVNYVNAPFYGEIVDGKRYGLTAWVKKALAEQSRGNTSIIVWPMDGWFHKLLAAGAEMRSLGEVRWVAAEDGTPQMSASRETVMFILRPEKKLGALATTMAMSGRSSSEIKKLIAVPKSHGYHMDALKAAYSRSLAAEVEQ